MNILFLEQMTSEESSEGLCGPSYSWSSVYDFKIVRATSDPLDRGKI